MTFRLHRLTRSDLGLFAAWKASLALALFSSIVLGQQCPATIDVSFGGYADTTLSPANPSESRSFTVTFQGLTWTFKNTAEYSPGKYSCPLHLLASLTSPSGTLSHPPGNNQGNIYNFTSAVFLGFLPLYVASASCSGQSVATNVYICLGNDELPDGESWSTSAYFSNVPTGNSAMVTADQISTLSETGVTATAELTVTFAPPCPAVSPCISTPNDGANPQSQFVAVTGSGQVGHTLDVLIDGHPVGSVKVDSDGNWEALPYVSPFGSSVTVQVQDQVTFDTSNTITVHPSLASFPPGPAMSYSRLLPLRHADIVVTASVTSPQYVLYGPNYTHTALYLGGDSKGTPLIAEAIPAADPSASTFGQVRSLFLEQSTVWTEATRISAWHPPAGLPGATRNAIVSSAKTFTSLGLPYWPKSSFVTEIDAANALFIAFGGILNPRINGFLSALNADKNSTTMFICSTLVWRAYWEGTGRTLDISTPNNMTAAPGSIMGNLPLPFRGAFLNNLASVFIVPETFVTSPKLSQIF